MWLRNELRDLSGTGLSDVRTERCDVYSLAID